MPKFIASYDLKETRPDPHETFLEKAEERGWHAWIKGSNGRWYRLPNTTLWGTFGTRPEAVAALKSAKVATQRAIGRPVTMEKWIVASYTLASFDSNERVKS